MESSARVQRKKKYCATAKTVDLFGKSAREREREKQCFDVEIGLTLTTPKRAENEKLEGKSTAEKMQFVKEKYFAMKTH